MDQVQEEESFLSASNEEVIEVQYLLVESQNHNPSMDGVLGFHMENQEKCMTNIDFPGKFGGPHPNATGEREEREQLKILDGMLPEAQVGHLQAANGIFTACEDYLIDPSTDVGFAEGVANFDYDSHLGNSGSDSQISGFSCGVNGIFDSSSTLVPECQNNLVEKTICELNRNVNSKCEFETSIETKWLQCPMSYVSQNVEKLEDVSNLLVKGVSSDNEKDIGFTSGLSFSEMSYSAMIVQNKDRPPIAQDLETESQSVQDVITESYAQDSNVCARFTQKRSRKPTLRYIDESSDQNSRYSRKRCEIFTSTSKSRCEISSSTSKGKTPEVRHLNHRHMGSWTTDESFSKAIQVPFDSKGREEHRKKRAFIEVRKNYMETSPDRSKCDSAKTIMSEEDGGQRKHHKLWAISEVRKLIDGVSEYGVGRWTQIKRLLFASSAHRTPVDLKDKWRNLLKASCAEQQSKKENEKRRNQPWRPLPKSMLRRVSELAMIYPCPRDDKSKLSHARHVFSPSHAARRKSSPLHISRRIGHRKTALE